MLWDGRPIGLEERLRFGYMPEERGLYPRMPVGEQLAYFGTLHGLSDAAARAAAARWLERLGLAGRAGAKVEELSHGNQQRAQLAAALLHEPELLVLDEPFAGLDPLAVQSSPRCSAARRRAARPFSSRATSSSSSRTSARRSRSSTAAASSRRAMWTRSDGRRSGGGSSSSSTARRAQWLPDVAGVELVERRNGDLRLLAGRDVDPQRVLAAAERSAQVVAFSYGPPSLAELFLELVAPMSGPARDRARRAARDPRAPAQQGVPRLDARHARARRRIDRARARSTSRRQTYRVAVTAPAPPGLAAALERAAKPFDDAKVRLRVVASPAVGRRLLEAEEVDALLLLSDDRLVFRAERRREGGRGRRHGRARPPPSPAAGAGADDGDAPPARARRRRDAEVLVAYVGSLLLLTSLAIYGQWVVSGVVEEKNNRVVELILSTVRPRHLLAGKVIGIGLLGLAQLALVAGLAAALLVAGVFDAPAGLGGNVALVIPWFALGFALYAVAYAAAGALASRQQNADTAGQPVTYTLLAVYFAGYVAARQRPDGLLAHVAHGLPGSPRRSCFPPAARSSACRSGSTSLALVLVLATIYALVRFAGRIYAQGCFAAGRASASGRRGA